MTRPAALAALKEKPPLIWGDAFRLCRMGLGWSHKDVVNRAARDCTKAEVMRWEAGDTYPSPAQLKLLRKFIPKIREWDSLLPLQLREDPRKRQEPAPAPAPIPAPAAPPPPPTEITEWRGPRVDSFGAALRYCREKEGMTQKNVGLLVGVENTTYSRWEQGNLVKGEPMRMIKENYFKLCDIFPMLAFAPKPEFSAKFDNAIKKSGYMKKREADYAQAIASRAVEVAVEEHMEAVAPKPPDLAPLNQRGAEYGVLRARKMALDAKLVKMKAEYETAVSRIEAEKEEIDRQMKQADEEMMRAAAEAHEVTL